MTRPLLRLSLAVFFLALFQQNSPAQADESKISSAAALPSHYTPKGSASDLITSRDKFAPFAAAVRPEIESALAAGNIGDPATVKELKNALLNLDLLDGKIDDARRQIAELRSLETDQGIQLTIGLITEVRLDVQDKTKITDLTDSGFQQAFQATLTERVKALPWSAVGPELRTTKTAFTAMTLDDKLRWAQSHIDPVVSKTGSLNLDQVAAIIRFRANLEFSLPLKKAVLAVLSPVIESHNNVD